MNILIKAILKFCTTNQPFNYVIFLNFLWLYYIFDLTQARFWSTKSLVRERKQKVFTYALVFVTYIGE